MIRWWHRRKGHTQIASRVTVAMFDPSSKGLLIKCSCGKNWAK